MIYNNLENYLATHYSLMVNHKWPMEYVDQMMVWERDYYIQILNNNISEQQEHRTF